MLPALSMPTPVPTPVPNSAPASALIPLSNHDALVLAEPFARRGYRVDLAASDRAARQLVFRAAPVTVGGAASEAGLAQTQLLLESLGTGTCRLTRRLSARTIQGGTNTTNTTNTTSTAASAASASTVAGTNGASGTSSAGSALQATLKAQGSDVAALLARIEAVDPAIHLRHGDGWTIARDYWLGADGTPVLTRGVVQVDGLRLTMTVSLVRGVSAELRLEGPVHSGTGTGAAHGLLSLPDDLLAVLGWDWARLVSERGGGWTTRMRLRGAAARRTRQAEAALERAAAHLALTLAEPPARYHERHRAARWGVVLRRSIPVLTPVALLVTVLGMPKLDTSGGLGLWWLLYHVPTVLIAASFCLQELPRFEIPPLPRRSPLGSWRQRASASPAGLAGQAQDPSA